MLDFINYPVSAILWFWHKVFGAVFGPASGISWVLGIVFLTFTVRVILLKPFVKQVRSMRKMQEFQPEFKKLQKKYANDKQKLAQEMQKLQSQHGVNPLAGCLPILLQLPVFLGLNNVLRGFEEPDAPKVGNYIFKIEEVKSYLNADLFGARLSNYISQAQDQLGDISRTSVILVAVPLMIVAAIATHFTSRHSVARQNPAMATPQTAIMNKITLYVFPIGVLVGGAVFPFPIGLLVYWLSNNAWTLMQQWLIYRKIDREEEEKKVATTQKRTALGPKPGQKPTQPKKRAPQPKATEAAGKEGTAKDADKAGDKSTDKSADKPAKGGTAGANSTKPAKATGSTNGAAKKSTDGDDKIPGLISDRSRSKRTGRKRS